MPGPDMREKVELLKESGRRRVFRVRFPDIYGLQEGFLLRTLVRGEILDAFVALGHPERKIPVEKINSQALLEERLVQVAVVDFPENFLLLRAPAGVISKLAHTILTESGFFDESPRQNEYLDQGFRYANSMEGRADALILHYLPGMRPVDLDRLGYREWSRHVFQAILLAKAIDGKDLREFLTAEDIALEEILSGQSQEPSVSPKPSSGDNHVVPGTIRNSGKNNLKPHTRQDIQQVLSTKVPIDPVRNLNFSPQALHDATEPRVFMAGERYDPKAVNRQIQQDLNS